MGGEEGQFENANTAVCLYPRRRFVRSLKCQPCKCAKYVEKRDSINVTETSMKQLGVDGN